MIVRKRAGCLVNQSILCGILMARCGEDVGLLIAIVPSQLSRYLGGDHKPSALHQIDLPRCLSAGSHKFGVPQFKFRQPFGSVDICSCGHGNQLQVPLVPPAKMIVKGNLLGHISQCHDTRLGKIAECPKYLVRGLRFHSGLSMFRYMPPSLKFVFKGPKFSNRV